MLLLHSVSGILGDSGQFGTGEASLLDGIAVGVLTRGYPVDEVSSVVAATGVQEQRSRKLPSWSVVYFVMAMALFNRSGYADVWGRLMSGLAWQSFEASYCLLTGQPSTAALTKARARLGWKVMQELLKRSCAVIAKSGLDDPAPAGSQRVLYLDSAGIDIPDTPSNLRGFGLPRQVSASGSRPGLPQVRVTAIADGRTYQLLATEIGGADEDLSSVMRRLLCVIRSGDLVVAGPGLLNAIDIDQLAAAGVSVLAPHPEKSSQDGVHTAPSDDLSRMYSERWCLTSALGAIVGQLSGGKEPVLRSRGPEGILQETYGLMCVYQAIRSMIMCTETDFHQQSSALAWLTSGPIRTPQS